MISVPAYPQKAVAMLRFALVFVFLWFGYQQVAHPEHWIYFLPEFTSKLPLSAELFVQLNGAFELVFGVLMALGLCTRFSAALLGLHLLGIAISVGDAIGVRDFGLAMATLSIAANMPDVYTLDYKRAAKKPATPDASPAVGA